MAARKKSTTKKSAKARGATAAARLNRLAQDLPPTLRDFQKRVQSQLTRLEKEVTRAQTDARRQAARLLRQASHQLGRLEAEGEGAWRRLTENARKELLRLLRRLEAAVEPGGIAKRAKSTARKATARARKGARAAASAVSDAASSAGLDS